MPGRPVGVTKVKIAQIDWKGHRGAQYAYGIPLVDRKVTQHQQTPKRAAFPEAKGNHTFSRPLRSDPLDDKPQAENKGAGQSHDFPRMNQDSEKVRLGEKLKAVHKAKTFRQISAGNQLFVSPNAHHTALFQRYA
jgi:hypothetical protein